MDKQEAEKVKQQLIQNVESNMPKERAEVLKRQIVSMSDEQLENFINRGSSPESSCIFCSIASGKTDSFKIHENKHAVAVLEINPASKGHVLVIPIEHTPLDSFTSDIKIFAGEVAQILKDKLGPKDIEISSQEFGGHGVMNLVPIHNGESINAARSKISKEELKGIFESLTKKEEIKEEKPKKEKKKRVERINNKKTWLPKRIP